MRFDGRKDDELREIEIKIGVIENADGSAYFRQGNTEIIAGVYGPRLLHPKHLQDPRKALLRVQYDMLTFSVPERKRPGPTRRSIELSKVIRKALESVVFLEEFPRSVIDVYIRVLNADAGTRCASVNAAVLALVDAGIPMKSLISAVAVGKVGQRVVLDLTKMEEDYGKFVPENDYYGPGGATDIPLAYNPLSKEFVLLQMDGDIDKESFFKALELGIKGAEEIYEMMKKAVREKYQVVILEENQD